MPQVFFKNLVSVDWLSMMVKSMDINFAKYHSDMFLWHPRNYGTKQFKNIVDLSFIDEDAVVQPFGLFCYEPTLEQWEVTSGSLKLANSLFYCDYRILWQDLLLQFLTTYQMQVISISRCDLACDFLFLLNRVSGPMLIEKLKSFDWWKCGSVKCCEYYKMPYSIDVPAFADTTQSDMQVFLQQGKLQSRTESLTFGTMSSDAQVCIYDKTLELMRTETDVELFGENVRVSAKEYIRDAHKAAGVYHDKRHTWRVEIRLRNKAAFLIDNKNGIERPLYITDLTPQNLPNLFHLAANKYFRLIDASLGGHRKVTAEVIQKFSAHKNRLPEVDLFRPKTLTLALSKKKYQKNPTRFTKAVISSLEKHSDELSNIKSTPAQRNLMPDDANVLHQAAIILRAIYAGQYADIRDRRIDIYEANFYELYYFFNQGFYMPTKVVELLYKYIFTKSYVSVEFLQKVLQSDTQCNFYQWVRCNCNIITYYDLLNIPYTEDRWVAPTIAPENDRNIPNLLTVLLNEQH